MLLETQDLTIWICDIFEIERTPTTFTTDNAPFNFISCRISGKGYFKQNGKIFPYNPGELILSPGNISYSQCCEEDEHLIVIHSKIGGYWPKEIEVIKLYDPEGSRTPDALRLNIAGGKKVIGAASWKADLRTV